MCTRRCAGLQVLQAISTASACLIKLISIGLSYRAREPRYTFTRAIATVQAFVSAPTFTISIWYRYASLLITMSETPRAPFVGARLRSCTVTVTQPGPSAVRYASRLEISTIYPTGIGTRLTRADRYSPSDPTSWFRSIGRSGPDTKGTIESYGLGEIFRFLSIYIAR